MHNGCCQGGARGPLQPGSDASGENSVPLGQPSTDGMVFLEGGAFLMGTSDKEAWADDAEGPVREVRLDPFWMDKTAVTNAEFERFVAETGYKTEAEIFGWSYVFHLFVPSKIKRKRGASLALRDLDWWMGVEGACWKRPEGRGSTIRKRMDHPVVHVSWRDATSFARWAGKRLPTEAEWEYAARGGLEQKRYCWGDELVPEKRHMCNIWQGTFPDYNTKADGYEGTAPAQSFPKNGYGLYNMSGNVWEWCADWFSTTWHVEASPERRLNPQGPPESGAMRSPDGLLLKVIRGGSYLCHDSYCNRYRVAARTSNTPDSSTGHCGFRCALSAQ